jgi:hypothetical protein
MNRQNKMLGEGPGLSPSPLASKNKNKICTFIEAFASQNSATFILSFFAIARCRNNLKIIPMISVHCYWYRSHSSIALGRRTFKSGHCESITIIVKDFRLKNIVARGRSSYVPNWYQRVCLLTGSLVTLQMGWNRIYKDLCLGSGLFVIYKR